MSSEDKQVTLTMDDVDVDMTECPECGGELADPEDYDEPGTSMTTHDVYRKHRETHYSWGDSVDPDDDETLASYYQNSSSSSVSSTTTDDEDDEEDRGPDTYRVTVSYTGSEVVEVEAWDKSSAESKAKDNIDWEPTDGHITHADAQKKR